MLLLLVFISYQLPYVFLIDKKKHIKPKVNFTLTISQWLTKPVEAHLWAEASGYVPIPSITVLLVVVVVCFTL